jgi:hypothetical protein
MLPISFSTTKTLLCLLVVFWVMSLKEIVAVVDRLNAIAFHVRSGKLIKGKMLECDICGRFYSFQFFAQHKCIHATTPISEIQAILDKLRERTNNDFSRFKHFTFEEAYNEWLENNREKISRK